MSFSAVLCTLAIQPYELVQTTSENDTQIAQLKKDIQALGTDFRNPLLHGGGGRPEDGLVVEWSAGRNVVVFEDKNPTDQYMLWRPALTEAQVRDLLERISRIDAKFETHPFFDWCRSGLPGDFRQDRVRRALAVVENGDIQEYIEAMGAAFDQDINQG